MITYTSVARPVYANAEKTAINCEVAFPHLGALPVLFTAGKNGLDHERLIFSECEAGRYGPVGPYARDAGVAILQITTIRNDRLAAGYDDSVTGKTWQCDDSSVGKWTVISASAGISMLAGQSPEPRFDLIAADNTKVTLTATEVFDLFNRRVMPWVSATMLRARDLKNMAIAGTAPDDLTKGWP